jgi:hypothetical protein
MIAASLLALERSPATADLAPVVTSVMTTAATGMMSSPPTARPVLCITTESESRSFCSATARATVGKAACMPDSEERSSKVSAVSVPASGGNDAGNELLRSGESTSAYAF